MDRLGELVTAIDKMLNTQTKRHIAGGILMSISLLFGGLAVTIITLKVETTEETEDEFYLE